MRSGGQSEGAHLGPLNEGWGTAMTPLPTHEAGDGVTA